MTTEGEDIGEHTGLMYYTIGQRQGIGVGGLKKSNDQPWYVVAKNLADNTLLVAQGKQHPALFKTHLSASQLYWVQDQAPENIPFTCDAKIRYRQAQQHCTIIQLEDRNCIVKFDQPQRAITSGQSIVFYTGEDCLGGGIIEHAYNLDESIHG